MVHSQEYWLSKIFYNDLVKAIPTFEGLKPSENIRVEDRESNLSYQVLTTPLRSLDERLENAANNLVGGKPSSQMTMISRDLIKGGLGFGAMIMRGIFHSLNVPDAFEQTKDDFHVFLQDIKGNKVHFLSVNHEQSRMVYHYSQNVEFNNKGKVVKEGKLNFLENDKFHDLLTSDKFRDNFKSLKQNIIT